MKLNLCSAVQTPKIDKEEEEEEEEEREKEDPTSTRLGDDLFIVCFRVTDRSVGCACCCCCR